MFFFIYFVSLGKLVDNRKSSKTETEEQLKAITNKQKHKEILPPKRKQNLAKT